MKLIHAMLFLEFGADGLLAVRILSASYFRYVYGSEVASLRTSDDEIVSEGELKQFF